MNKAKSIESDPGPSKTSIAVAGLPATNSKTFQDLNKNVLNITATHESLPLDFKQAVRMLKRPYIGISEDTAMLIEQAIQGHGDIFIVDGRKMTYGNADGGWALMPIATVL